MPVEFDIIVIQCGSLISLILNQGNVGLPKQW